MVLAWLLPDERSDVAQRLLLRTAQDRPAPSLLLIGVGNNSAAGRAQPLRRATASLLDAFTALPIALEPISAEEAMLGRRTRLRHALTLYDACYLELAMSRGCPLATFDQALVRGGARRDVVVPTGRP